VNLLIGALIAVASVLAIYVIELRCRVRHWKDEYARVSAHLTEEKDLRIDLRNQLRIVREAARKFNDTAFGVRKDG
jgi:hypothetical protein